MQLTRTTVRMNENLLIAAKHRALLENTTLQEFINQAILARLNKQQANVKTPQFDDKDMGYKLNRPLRRSDLY